MPNKRFPFNDETVINSYGFKILTAGISLDRFLSNPVMLDGHWNDTSNVIGNWENVSVEGSVLAGEPNFDMEDEAAKKLAGKVERGFIKACSMGVTFDRDKMKQQPDGTWVLSECELFEVSLVAIPSNRSCVRLFSIEGVEMKEDEIKLAVANLTSEPNFNKNKEPKMDKVTLSIKSLLALGLDEQPTDSKLLDAKILQLSADLAAEKLAHQETKDSIKAGAAERAKNLVEQAKLAGKITGAEEKQYIQDATDNYELTARLLAKIPATTKLGVTNTCAVGTVENPKTVDEFEKLSADAKLAFKTDFPAEYKALFAKK